MADAMNPDLDRIGLFKEMAYLHGAGPTETIELNRASHRGKQMLTTCSKKKAANQDGYFEKVFARIFEGESYNDPIKLRRRFRLELVSKRRDETWRPLSASKDMCGRGMDYGTFQEYMDEVRVALSPVKKPFVKTDCHARNVLIKPPPQGSGYGYPNVTISKLPPYFLEEEYEILLEAGPELRTQPQWEEGQKVFILGTREEEYFDKNPFFEESPTGPLHRLLAKAPPIQVIFWPPAPGKKDGGMKAGTFDKYPEHFSGVAILTGEFLKPFRGTKNEVNTSGRTFKPWPGVRVYPVLSVIVKNVNMRISEDTLTSLSGVVYCKK